MSAIDDHEHLKYLFVGYLNGKSNERTNSRSLAPQFMQLGVGVRVQGLSPQSP
jgi:hypothetical protein